MATALPLYNVLVLGPFGVGKTTIASWLTADTEKERRSDKRLYDRECYEIRVCLRNGDRVLVRLHDTCEMEREKGTALPTNVFRNKDGFVLVWDIKRGETLRELKDWHQAVMGYVSEENFPSFIIFANKAEKELNIDSEEFKSCVNWSSQIGVPCLKTSSLEGDNLNEGLQVLADSMASKVPTFIPKKKAQSPVKLGQKETNVDRKCCES